MNTIKQHSKLLKLQEKAETCLSREEAQKLIERGGFDILKIRLGRTNIDEDIYAIESVKKALGKENILLSCLFDGSPVFWSILTKLRPEGILKGTLLWLIFASFIKDLNMGTATEEPVCL